MNRRDFLLGSAASWLMAKSAGYAAPAVTPAPGMAVVELGRRGPAIPSDFMGLSYESGMISNPGFFAADNHSLIGLIRRLGSHGVIRIGGNSSEFTRWAPSIGAAAAPAPAGRRFSVITPGDITRLAGFIHATGWRLLYGLNLGHGTPESAASEAAAVAAAVGDSLLAFQIGNEVDLFSHNHLRAKTYGVADFLAEWKQYADAVRAKVPHAKFAGPDTASHTDWVTAMADQAPPDLVLLSRHYYAGGPGMTAERLLGSLTRLKRTFAPLRKLSAETKLPYRITEGNSSYHGGQAGVGDTLVSALWGADFLFQLAQEHGAGMNFHGGAGGVYTPIARVRDADYTARPLYYGLLLFAQAARGRLVPAQVDPALNVGFYAAQDRAGTLRVTVINRHVAQPAKLTVDSGKNHRTASAMYLTGPALDSKEGVTLGGAAVGPDGAWAPTATTPVKLDGARFPLEIPVGSAVVVTLG
ncbi:MAG TPA: glycosyl hydrolase family 79 C-terminal domain-containing protein [Armatimonadota bacterium]|nr:glycosyl hydrolase family 79 C-terminal domain-containing protein [Armatimonadota bacterium]